jgi:hypothetical protein
MNISRVEFSVLTSSPYQQGMQSPLGAKKRIIQDKHFKEQLATIFPTILGDAKIKPIDCIS